MTDDRRSIAERLGGGGKVVNGWCSIPSAFTAEITAQQGFDTVTIDLQHGLVDYQTALQMLQAVDRRGVPVLCRAPWNEPGIIMKLLDAGFSGVICPMVSTRAEAEAFVGACRYAPRGYRSYGPTRALQVHGPDYAERADTMIFTMAMIETAEALENLDAILAVPGLDGVYVGPSDLAISLGFRPTLLPADEPVVSAIEEIRARAAAAGKRTGIHCGSPRMVREMLAAGFDFASLLTDARIFAQAVGAQLAEARGERPPEVAAGQY